MRQIATRDRWATPSVLVDAVAHLEFGGTPPIVDLCCTDENAKAEAKITEELNLFRLSPVEMASWMKSPTCWAWMNPPFSRGNLPMFTRWGRAFVEAGGTLAVLTPARMSDGWFRKNIYMHAHTILIPHRRIAFEPPEGVSASSSRDNHCVTIMRPEWVAHPTIKIFDWTGKVSVAELEREQYRRWLDTGCE